MKHPLKFLAIPVATLATLGLAAGVWAYWATGGVGNASASVGFLSAPTNVDADVDSVIKDKVNVSWDAPQSPSVAPAGYYVERLGGPSPAPACGTVSGGTLVGAAQVTCNDTGVDDGTYTYRVTAVYATWSWTAVNEAENSGPVTVDTVDPAVTVNDVADPTNDNTPLFSGTYGAAPGDLAPVSVTLYSGSGTGGPQVGSSSTATPGAGNTWSAQWTSPLPDGTYTVAARQNDTAGNTGVDTDTFAVSTPPAPPSTPNLDPGSDSGSSSTDDITNDFTPTFTGTAEAGVTVTIYDGATAVGTGVAAAGGNWSITTGSLTGGPHTIRATASRAGGTPSGLSPSLGITIDLTPPNAPAPKVNGKS